MSAVPPAVESPDSATPCLLWDLPSRPRVFFSNLRDFVFPPNLKELELESAPADFWPDVFVKRGLPWSRFVQSGVYHGIAGALVIALANLFALQPHVAPVASFDHSQVIYYQPSEYLPQLDTRSDASAKPQKADPEFSRQPIISVPREADNGRQTVVTPPQAKLKRDIVMPNIVAWSNSAQKPRLEIPPAPATPAAEITRLAPKLDASVAPPPDDAHLTRRLNSPTLQAPVAAPPTNVDDSMARGKFPGLQPALVAPPTDIASTSRRSLGEMNIAPSSVVAPAPQLPVAAQRSVPGGGLTSGSRVVPPPPSLASSGSPGGSTGSRGQIIALNLHPSIGAPPDPSAGNRRGSFAATPEGHVGATGAPGSKAGAGSASTGANGSARKESSGIPTGLYVGTPAAPAAPVAGDPPKTTSTNPDLVASVHPPRVTNAHPMEPESAAKLTEPERAVFGNRKFYSVMINTPNLNSSGGSWVIRFAELNHDSGPRDENAPVPDLSQPMATRTVDPAYPVQLMRQNVAGTVILYAVIHADGSVGEIRVLRGVDDRLDRFAKEAVAQWKFEPATKNGSPVDVEATFKIPFRPSHVGTNF
jgi:TonB family protein